MILKLICKVQRPIHIILIQFVGTFAFYLVVYRQPQLFPTITGGRTEASITAFTWSLWCGFCILLTTFLHFWTTNFPEILAAFASVAYFVLFWTSRTISYETYSIKASSSMGLSCKFVTDFQFVVFVHYNVFVFILFNCLFQTLRPYHRGSHKNAKIQKYLHKASQDWCWLARAFNTEEERTLKQSTNRIYYVQTSSYNLKQWDKIRICKKRLTGEASR